MLASRIKELIDDYAPSVQHQHAIKIQFRTEAVQQYFVMSRNMRAAPKRKAEAVGRFLHREFVADWFPLNDSQQPGAAATIDL